MCCIGITTLLQCHPYLYVTHLLIPFTTAFHVVMQSSQCCTRTTKYNLETRANVCSISSAIVGLTGSAVEGWPENPDGPCRINIAAILVHQGDHGPYEFLHWRPFKIYVFR